MIIEHIAIWTKDLEKLKNYYVKFFNGESNQKYRNPNTLFESYFIPFDSECRLELMTNPDIKAVISYISTNAADTIRTVPEQ